MECVYDSSYPEIWDTPSLREQHLFETEDDCCDAWDCHTETVSQSDEGRWLSNEGGTDCVFLTFPSGMLEADWLFETRDGCCAVHTCPDEGTTTTTEATTTQEPSAKSEEMSDSNAHEVPSSAVPAWGGKSAKGACRIAHALQLVLHIKPHPRSSSLPKFSERASLVRGRRAYQPPSQRRKLS